MLQSLIVDKTINIQELLIGDKKFPIMVGARILGYGKDYEFEYDGEEQKVDLSKIESQPIDFSKLPKGTNEFTFELPTSKRQITFKLLSGKDEKNIEVGS